MEGGVLEIFIYSFLTHVFFLNPCCFCLFSVKIFSKIFLVIYIPVGTYLPTFFYFSPLRLQKHGFTAPIPYSEVR